MWYQFRLRKVLSIKYIAKSATDSEEAAALGMVSRLLGMLYDVWYVVPIAIYNA